MVGWAEFNVYERTGPEDGDVTAPIFIIFFNSVAKYNTANKTYLGQSKSNHFKTYFKNKNIKTKKVPMLEVWQ